MAEKTQRIQRGNAEFNNAEFKVVCISCGMKIRENASDDSYGMCLRCFYAMLAVRLRAQKRVAAGEYVSER